MENFDSSRNGYDRKQVDSFVEKLKDEIQEKDYTIAQLKRELQEYKNKDNEIKTKGENISIALTAAVEKAKQIEKSSQNVYKLKIQQIGLLYSRWEKLLNVFIEKYPGIEEIENVKGVLKEFKDSLKSTLKDDFKLNTITSPVQTDNDTIRLLLSKLNNYSDNKKQVRVERKQLSKDMLEGQTELSRIEDKAPLIKPIYEDKIQSGEQYENLADKFLRETDSETNAYASIITSKVRAIPEVNESGFDLKEAINPKEDLDEIMKAFDFFHGEDDE